MEEGADWDKEADPGILSNANSEWILMRAFKCLQEVGI